MLLRHLLEQICFGRGSAVVERLAEEIVQECHMPLKDRVRIRTYGMNRARMRGYISARARDVVAANADAVLSGHPLRLRMAPEAAALAIEQLVNLTVRDLLAADRFRNRRAVAA